MGSSFGYNVLRDRLDELRPPRWRVYILDHDQSRMSRSTGIPPSGLGRSACGVFAFAPRCWQFRRSIHVIALRLRRIEPFYFPMRVPEIGVFYIDAVTDIIDKSLFVFIDRIPKTGVFLECCPWLLG